MEYFRKNQGLKSHILIVDDEMINREILGHILSNDYNLAFAENGLQAYEMILENVTKYSLILLDLMMPEMDGFELLEKLKESEDTKNIPVIVMTSEKTAEVRSILLGAADFITKPYDSPEVIIARCHRIIELYEDRTFIRHTEKDVLTGLYTKAFFFEYIRQMEKDSTLGDMDVVVLNIEHFHLVNEMHGRETGDSVLRRTGKMLTEFFSGEFSIACRPDADTFYLYCTHRESYEDALSALENELKKISCIQHIRFRIGLYQSVDKSQEIENCFDRAKLACDSIRGDYTRQIALYNSYVHEEDIYNERLIGDIDEAVKNKDLIVFYQPKYDIQGETYRLRSAEALVRWNHPELGMISPGRFIPLFENNGLIQKVDRFVWEEAAAQIKSWKENYGVSIPVSVNVSRIDIYDPELESYLMSILDKNGLTTDDIMLEITESAYSENADAMIQVVNKLRDRGFKIEMDDFGSGYSSLNMLTTIPIDVLKMDMIFIRNMYKNEKSLKLVELVIEIAEFLGVPVIAEGVEDESQVLTLKEMGCDIIQGYYFSKPVPPEDFEQFIKQI